MRTISNQKIWLLMFNEDVAGYKFVFYMSYWF